MKNKLRTFFGFILNPLESGEEEFQTNRLARKVLLAISALFIGLGCIVFVIFLKTTSKDFGHLLPSIIFITIGILGLIVGLLANDRGVAKIWGGR